MTNRSEAHTFEDMKNATVTVRLPGSTRVQVARMARLEGRSLSGQIERLIEQGLGSRGARSGAQTDDKRRVSLAGLFRGGPVPSLEDFREVRADVSASLAGRRQRP